MDTPDRRRTFMEGYEAGRKAERLEWELKMRMLQAFLKGDWSGMTATAQMQRDNERARPIGEALAAHDAAILKENHD